MDGLGFQVRGQGLGRTAGCLEPIGSMQVE